jgi:hypothetical protein
MKIYFSHTPDSFDDTFTVVDEYGNPQHFYNCVEHDHMVDQITISDTCYRHMPIDIEDIPALIGALNYCWDNYETIKRGEEVGARLASSLQMFVDGDGLDVNNTMEF